MPWPPTEDPNDRTPPGPAGEEGRQELLSRVAFEAGLRVESGEGGVWLESDSGGPLAPVSEGEVRAALEDVSGGRYEEGLDAGAWVVASVGDRVGGGPSGLHARLAEGMAAAAADVTYEALAGAGVAVEGARRVLNAWAVVSPATAGADAGPPGGYVDIAAACLKAIVSGERRPAEFALDRLASLPQHPVIATSVRDRCCVLALRVRLAYSDSAYSEGLRDALHFARPAARPFHVDVEPIRLELPDAIPLLEPIARALMRDGADFGTSNNPGVRHKEEIEGLGYEDHLAIVRALRDKEAIVAIAKHVKSSVRVENVKGTMVEPPWDLVAQVFDALGVLFGVDLAISSTTIAKECRVG